MSYKSLAQERYFNANRKKLEAQGVSVDEWNKASKGLKLPKKKRKYQVGGNSPDFGQGDKVPLKHQYGGMRKYQFGGNDEQIAQDNNNFFSTLYQAAAQKQQQDQPQPPTDNTQSDVQPQEDYSSSIDDLNSQIEDLKSTISNMQQNVGYDPMTNDLHKNDDMLNLLFSQDNNNDPIVFGDNTTNTDQPFNYNTNISHGLTNYNSSVPSTFSGIFKNEGASIGQQSKTSSALGRGQMVKGTRMLMYKELGVNNVDSAEQKFRTDPNFEQTVLNKYREDLGKGIPANITGKQRDYMIAKGWYTGNVNYPDNKVPHPEAGNNLTAGEYASNAVKQTGGVANTPEELYNGLNNSPHDSMMLNLPDTYNTIRGLDSGQPVFIQDEHGKKAILRGNKQTAKMKGRVYEIRKNK